MKKHKLFFLLIGLFYSQITYSQTVNVPQNIEWDQAGAITEFPESFDSTFHVSTAESLQIAIDQAGAASGTNLVEISSGNFVIDQAIELQAGVHDNVYIRGAGPNHEMNTGASTVIKFNYSNPENFATTAGYGSHPAGIVIRGYNSSVIGKVIDYDASNNSITLSDVQNLLNEGDFIRIRADLVNGQWEHFLGQINRVELVHSPSAVTIKLEHNFSLAWEQSNSGSGSIDMVVHKINPIKNVGIKNLGLETIGYVPAELPDQFSNCNAYPASIQSPQFHHILIHLAHNTHIDNINSYKPISRHVLMMESYHNTVENSFFNDAVYRHGCADGGHGYGVDLFRKNTLNLIENNIFRHLRRSFTINRGSHKNVFGYNYFREIASQTGNIEERGDGSRNIYDSGNLVESNRIERILNDTYHNNTGYKNIFFRNYTYYSHLQTEGGSKYYFIGNKGFMKNTDFNAIKVDRYGYQNNHWGFPMAITHANSDSDDVYLDMTSLYLTQKPSFFYQADNWYEDYTWPAIGPKLTSNSELLLQDIPARGRYCEAYNDYIYVIYRCEGSPAFEELDVQILGPTQVEENNSGFWGNNTSGGEPPYSYTWRRSYNSSTGPWTQVGAGGNYSQTVTHDMWLKLTVTDSNCQGMMCNTVDDVMKVNVVTCGNPPCPMPKAPDGTQESLPQEFALLENYPNPFNPITTIDYDVPVQASVRIEVFNMLGQRVALLVDGEVQPGRHSSSFDASGLSSGAYLLRMEARGESGLFFNRTIGMQLVK